MITSTNRRILTLQTRQWGFNINRCILCPGGVSGFGGMGERFDIGILDFNMPMMSGTELGNKNPTDLP